MQEYLNLDSSAPVPSAERVPRGEGEAGDPTDESAHPSRWKGAVKRAREIREVLMRLREPTQGQLAADPKELMPDADYRHREGWLQAPPDKRRLGEGSRVFKKLPAQQLDAIFERFASEHSLLSSRVRLPNGDSLDGVDYLGREGWCQLGPDPGPAPPSPRRAGSSRFASAVVSVAQQPPAGLTARPASAGPSQMASSRAQLAQMAAQPETTRPASASALSPRAVRLTLAKAGRLVMAANRLAPSLNRHRLGDGDFALPIGELERRSLGDEGERFACLQGKTMAEFINVWQKTVDLQRLRRVQRHVRKRCRERRELREWAAAVIRRSLRRAVQRHLLVKRIRLEQKQAAERKAKAERARLIEEREQAEEAAANAPTSAGEAALDGESAPPADGLPGSPSGNTLEFAADDEKPSWASDMYERNGRPSTLRRDVIHKLSRRSLRIFLSSTFDDMREERDGFMRTVVPALRTLCDQRMVDLSVIDMGWGITDTQVKTGETMNICLSMLVDTDYFVGVLGARYGWTPLVKEGEISPDSYKAWEPLVQSYVSKFVAKTSITELEFLYGVLLRPLPAKATPNRVSNAFVYLRTDEYYEHMDPEERKRFYDGDDKKFEKLKALKVRSAHPMLCARCVRVACALWVRCVCVARAWLRSRAGAHTLTKAGRPSMIVHVPCLAHTATMLTMLGSHTPLPCSMGAGARQEPATGRARQPPWADAPPRHRGRAFLPCGLRVHRARARESHPLHRPRLPVGSELRGRRECRSGRQQRPLGRLTG